MPKYLKVDNFTRRKIGDLSLVPNLLWFRSELVRTCDQQVAGLTPGATNGRIATTIWHSINLINNNKFNFTKKSPMLTMIH